LADNTLGLNCVNVCDPLFMPHFDTSPFYDLTYNRVCRSPEASLLDVCATLCANNVRAVIPVTTPLFFLPTALISLYTVPD
jgi:hypothetical protein